MMCCNRVDSGVIAMSTMNISVPRSHEMRKRVEQPWCTRHFFAGRRHAAVIPNSVRSGLSEPSPSSPNPPLRPATRPFSLLCIARLFSPPSLWLDLTVPPRRPGTCRFLMSLLPRYSLLLSSWCRSLFMQSASPVEWTGSHYSYSNPFSHHFACSSPVNSSILHRLRNCVSLLRTLCASNLIVPNFSVEGKPAH